MPSSTLALLKRTLREAKRQQQQPNEPAPTTGTNTNTNATNAIEISETPDENVFEEEGPASPGGGSGGRFSSKRVIRGIRNRARGFSRSEGQQQQPSNSKQERTQLPSNKEEKDTSPSPPQTWAQSQKQQTQSLYNTPRSPLSPLGSPRSPFNPNKPLPSPPSLGSLQARDSPPKPVTVLKLNRIMATLTFEDVEKLFSGAPQYFARSEGHFTGAPHPSVAFPFDEELEIRDLTDHTQIEDEAWRGVTAWPHIVRDRNRRRLSEKPRAHFSPRCRERPNMLSMQGLEKGSMGYQAALEMSVSDSIQEEQFGFSSIGPKPQAIIEARQKLLTSKADLRHLSEAAILEQLIKTGERYQSGDSFRTPGFTNDMYNDLFLKMLYPPSRPIDREDPCSLPVQIQALVRVLAAPNIWIDFSHVEWRIRLGQLLWGMRNDDGVQDGEIDEGETEAERVEERYWLLLQILLACELLIRLDAITEGEELGVESIRPQEVLYFEKNANTPVKWSLLLARSWLDNIVVTKIEKTMLPAENHHAPASGWLASLTGKMTLSQDRNVARAHANDHPVYEIRGKYGERQVEGLTHFARKLRWPDIDLYEARISRTARSITRDSPLNSLDTPASVDTKRSSYFGVTPDSQTSASRRKKLSAALHPSGWISKSYVSGLVLPGEGISHLLMATLLENDGEAVAKLGFMANLYGGFIYNGKSFWSTRCIVGRVIGAGKGAVECMGWISSDLIPKGIKDGWVDIAADEVPADLKRTGRKARLWDKKNLEAESRVLGDADPNNVLPADFIIPFENIYKTPPPKVMSIDLTSLNLLAPADSDRITPIDEKLSTPFSDMTMNFPPSEIRTYPAAMTFYVKTDESEGKEMAFSLSNDIYFVTAHPCVPSNHVKIMKSPSSPTIQQIDISGSLPGSGSSRPSSSATITGHPLHKYYTYTAIHLSELLERKNESLNDLLNNTVVDRPTLTPTQNKTPRVLVIDCITGFQPQPQMHEIPASPILTRKGSSAFPFPPQTPGAQDRAEFKMHTESRKRQFGSDMEMLVRAFCAERGWNAIVSRRRRGCLGCAIREASALNWKVIVRVD